MSERYAFDKNPKQYVDIAMDLARITADVRAGARVMPGDARDALDSAKKIPFVLRSPGVLDGISCLESYLFLMAREGNRT